MGRRDVPASSRRRSPSPEARTVAFRRVWHPASLVRKGDQLVEASWNEALDLVAAEHVAPFAELDEGQVIVLVILKVSLRVAVVLARHWEIYPVEAVQDDPVCTGFHATRLQHLG